MEGTCSYTDNQQTKQKNNSNSDFRVIYRTHSSSTINGQIGFSKRLEVNQLDQSLTIIRQWNATIN